MPRDSEHFCVGKEVHTPDEQSDGGSALVRIEREPTVALNDTGLCVFQEARGCACKRERGRGRTAPAADR